MYTGFFGEKAPMPVEIRGKPLTCQVCGAGGFWCKRAQMSTVVASFFNTDWTERAAVCYVCADCGHVHWFLPT